jgi:hypothetical protein
MHRSRLIAPLSLLMIAPTLMLSGCVVDREHTVERPVPYEGYYDHEHHRYYHSNVWVACDVHDPHCPD